ncbi:MULTISPECIES: YfcC family protein [unclassified Halanaerobium]|uniref:YfcC family protein n=1 Tax=unclassified Halanaerobium TaxID=2641197 RepID=UPI000DF2E020|nr:MULTISPECIES: YfcC family protein [unclassified Halanaerobium]RCW40657.1 putative ion transporter superfamily protein YfcC [Halanaerobium sp. MA284_MarDTE_T2]RCW78778.1 putative ion transporter superfamily protein YfcC [Halanaerobium sp. DL-01]
MKKFKMPTAYTILFIIIIIVAMLTWVVPAGEYQKEAGKPVPGTYHQTDRNPQGIFDILKAPIDGFYDAVDVALFVLVIGGFLGVTMKSGAIDAGIAAVTKALKGKEIWMIPVLMTLFGIGGSTYGMAEETIAFYPLVIPIFIAAGYDAITAVSVILLGAGVGVLGSTVNPFATGIATNFAQISLGRGIGLRLAILVLGELIAIFYTMRYAKKVKNDPSKSLVYSQREENKEHFLGKKEDEFPEFTKRRKIIIAVFALTFLVMIFGVIPFEDLGITAVPTLWWWFGELSTLFMTSAIIIGLIAGMSEKKIVNSFVSGASDLISVALIVAISRGITIIMNNGNISGTVLNYGENLLSNLGSVSFTILAYLFYIPLSFLIPSTSGLATLSMPILAPLGDFANVSRNIVVTAYQSASGIVNLITPTSAVVMGGLAIAKVNYGKWIKYVWKLLLAIFLFTIIMLSLGVLI